MAANNDITGDVITTAPASKAYRDNYDQIFRKKQEVDVCDKCGQHYYENVEDECIEKVNCGFWKSLDKK
jgi:hypothetical protein